MKSLAWVALLAACSGGHDAPVADGPAPDVVTPDTGSGLPTPIKYVVVIVKENHSFDNYFTNFPGAESSMTAKLHDGTTITRQKAPDGMLPGDVSHSRTSWLKDYDNGKMDGFDTIVASDPRRPFMYYTEAQIPNYWAYARNFALFDHFFSTLGGPSSPGHFAIISSQTPHYANPTCNDGTDDCLSGCRDTTARPSCRPTTPTPARRRCTTRASRCRASSTCCPTGMTWRTYGGGSGHNRRQRVRPREGHRRGRPACATRTSSRTRS